MDLRRKIALWLCPELSMEAANNPSYMEYETLTHLAESLTAFIGRSEATLSNKIVGHARFFSRLRKGEGCSVTSFNMVFKWFDENWPEDLAWPKGITRPNPTKKKVA